MTKRAAILGPGFKTVYQYTDETPVAVAEAWITCGGCNLRGDVLDLFRTQDDTRIADEILAAWKFKTVPKLADLIAAVAAYRARETE